MKRYKVTLTPIGNFFFGGEQTFDNGVRQSYFARSERMPQQTTLLGMVRYQLLKQAQLLSIPFSSNDDRVSALVGSGSFNFANSAKQSFGRIVNISPVRLQHKGQILFPLSRSHGMETFLNGEVRTYCGNIERKGMVEFGTFDEKTYSNYCSLIGEDGNIFDYDDLFLTNEQVGIIKDRNNGDNKAFFKKEVLRFKDEEDAFVFFLSLEDDAELKDDKVFMGAERSCFDMRVDSAGKEPDYPVEICEGTILITSPTYVPDMKTLGDYCLFLWSDSIGFRNLEQKEGGKLSSGTVSYKRSSKLYTMLSAGSVLFYRSDKLNVLKDLLHIPNLEQIGYNQYTIK